MMVYVAQLIAGIAIGCILGRKELKQIIGSMKEKNNDK